jgi:hypothetical protein
LKLALATLVFVLAFAAAGCGGGGGGKKEAVTTTVTTMATATNPTGTTPSVTTHGRYKYPSGLVKSYMDSCTKGDAAKNAYCACTLDKLSNDVSIRDFVKVGLAGGKLPPRMQRLIMQAAKDCVDKL